MCGGTQNDAAGGVAQVLVTVNNGPLSPSSVFVFSTSPPCGELNSPFLSCGRDAAVWVLEPFSVRVLQPWSPMSLSTGGGTLGITVVPVPAVR